MPKALLDFLGYAFYFWSNENNEQPHGTPAENATTSILTKLGKAVLGYVWHFKIGSCQGWQPLKILLDLSSKNDKLFIRRR